jgi:hypothetical protein
MIYWRSTIFAQFSVCFKGLAVFEIVAYDRYRRVSYCTVCDTNFKCGVKFVKENCSNLSPSEP